MRDFIDTLGVQLKDTLGVDYAGQEPQNKDDIAGDLVIIQRLGGLGSQYGRSDRPWIQFTALSHTKQGAADLLREVRRLMFQPKSTLGDYYVYRVTEALPPEGATLPRDPFYRYRATFEFHVSGLA
nr:MAG TPA: hypothetical protein [Caudoviricetes sp.]